VASRFSSSSAARSAGSAWSASHSLSSRSPSSTICRGKFCSRKRKTKL
jgi:hypothetical protein